MICSCNKEEFKTVTITGKVNNLGTLIPEAGARVVLIRSESLNNDGRGQGIVAVVNTDVNGNFVLTNEISNQFDYTLKIDEDENEYWLTKEHWGTLNQYEMQYNNPLNNCDFYISKKAELDIDVNFINIRDTIDVITFKWFRPDGNAYFFNSYSNPDSLFSELVLRYPYLSYNRKLMEGNQYLEGTYTHNGIDSLFSINYTLDPNQVTYITIDIFN